MEEARSTSKGEEEPASSALPSFEVENFNLTYPPECDMIMKGGITSGVVYPYALLQIATKYRFRSLGGTSAGAIAAAFAAAAEYGRQNGRPEAFMILKEYADELPGRLLSLFQPSPSLNSVVGPIKSAIRAGGVKPIVWQGVMRTVLPALAAAAVIGLVARYLRPDPLISSLAAFLGLIAVFNLALFFWLKLNFISPLLSAWRDLPAHNFGFCTGLTQPGNDGPGLTDWIYHALQHIAFGDKNHPVPLTFGHLQGSDTEKPEINLKVVTTNLSMRRPHTLPQLGVTAAFMKAEWEKLFPTPVMDYLFTKGTRPWKRYTGSWLFPKEDKLPVIVAVRMSLSFPLLFTAVPLKIKDVELGAIANTLGAKARKRILTAYFSDGGISSNFPIHMFDAPLPSRPTFAFSLDELWENSGAKRRVTLPETAAQGMGVPMKDIQCLRDFGWQIISSAKDWQDQLLSEITGQRERIVRIFLNESEGGLNLDMPPELSRELMAWGCEAGAKFTDGTFDFEEHKWRRLLVLYKHLEKNLNAIDKIWDNGFGDWYNGYYPHAKTYRSLTLRERRQIAIDITNLLGSRGALQQNEVINPDIKLPRLRTR